MAVEKYKIPFNKPYFTGKELAYIQDAVDRRHLSGNGYYSKKCHAFFEERYAFKKCLLTHSCSSALDMTALLIDIKPGDEVILPSYTFVSTANAFALRGAVLKFADSEANNPNVSVKDVQRLITDKTRAIVVVHYAGFSCDLDPLIELCQKHKIYLIEDAAHAIESFYKGKALGSIGHLSTFSFHETKNIISGEGGMLVINDESLMERAEIIWEKGTNRTAFERGEVAKYEWVDLGSSFLPSESTAAFLFAQLEHLEEIQGRRRAIWVKYHESFQQLESKDLVSLPDVPEYATINGHFYYLVCNDQNQRNSLIKHLKENSIHAVFHYQALHASPYFKGQYSGPELIHAQRFTNALVRLPSFFGITSQEQDRVISAVLEFIM